MARSHPIRKVVAANVRRRRMELQLSQERLGELCGLHQTYLSEVEGAKRNLSLDALGQIADALDVPPASLLIPNSK